MKMNGRRKKGDSPVSSSETNRPNSIPVVRTLLVEPPLRSEALRIRTLMSRSPSVEEEDLGSGGDEVGLAVGSEESRVAGRWKNERSKRVRRLGRIVDDTEKLYMSTYLASR